MRSVEACWAAIILAAGLWAGPAQAQSDLARPAPSASAVAAAASAARADPQLRGTETVRELRWKKDKEKKKDEQPRDGSARWWRELVENLSWSLRLIIWLVGAALLAWLLLRVRDWLLARESGHRAAAGAPTHVGSLDIRPESLPADVGAAARVLWQHGETRAALSLLYRGALSRLAHEHGVPIRAASTERDCLALAATRLAAPSQAFLAQLVAGWQTVAYARRELPAEDFEQLCAQFDRRMARGEPA